MEDKINPKKLKRYFSVTEEALAEAVKKISKERKEDAKEIIEMVKNYLSDAHHFEKKNDLVNAFAAINYAHCWLDCGVRQGIFDVKNRDLFTVK